MSIGLLPAQSEFNELTGVSTLEEVLQSVNQQVVTGQIGHMRPLSTGYMPLDDVLNGGLRAGDLFILGGPSGVGKTIFSLQAARNVVLSDPEATRQVGRTARKTIYLSWDDIANKAVERYEMLIERCKTNVK